MNTIGYIINSVLVLLVLRQIREHRLDRRSLVLPLVLVAVAAANFLHTIPTAGNDLELELGLVALGASMGLLCGLTTHLRLDGSTPLGRAGFAAASLWIAGCGARLAFAYGAGHGLGPSLARFSIHHSITGAPAWVAALVLMALADVTARTLVLHTRGRRLAQRSRIAGERPIVFA
jgi:hypothetical protein